MCHWGNEYHYSWGRVTPTHVDQAVGPYALVKLHRAHLGDVCAHGAVHTRAVDTQHDGKIDRRPHRICRGRGRGSVWVGNKPMYVEACRGGCKGGTGLIQIEAQVSYFAQGSVYLAQHNQSCYKILVQNIHLLIIKVCATILWALFNLAHTEASLWHVFFFTKVDHLGSWPLSSLSSRWPTWPGLLNKVCPRNGTYVG